MRIALRTAFPRKSPFRSMIGRKGAAVGKNELRVLHREAALVHDQAKNVSTFHVEHPIQPVLDAPMAAYRARKRFNIELG